MALLTQLLAAEEDEVEAIGESLQPLDEWSGIQLRDLTIPRIATLHSVLTGDLYDDACALYEPAHVSELEGAIVLRMADAVTERLVELDEDAIDAIATELVATEDFEYAGWDEEEVVAMLSDLADLARLADSQGQVLFAWLHPLRT